jgi:23S rRNA pseudouridine2604 synthase
MNRQIRRMAENQGYKVLDLERIRIDKISDNHLGLGKWRDLTALEIKCFIKN